MLKIYSTLSRQKQSLKLVKGEKLQLFVCGVTTYDFSHIGHARTYIAFDMIVKYLRQLRHNVFYLQNVTDIDDKIIKRAKEAKEDVMKLSRRFEKEYMVDMKNLGVTAPSTYARATSYIPEIVSQVKRLLGKGYAYEIEKEGIYFDISKFKEYGKLSGRNTEQAEDAVSRIDESVGKRNKGDFALWKYSKKDEPSWGFGSPATPRKLSLRGGRGRPGWHIEDTAITEKFFGPQYDIHGGAQDLIFPHHEAEITQMEAVSGKKPLVQIWMHTGFLTVNGEKMSKSAGNFITIRDFLKNHPARLLRFFVLKTHYRSPIDYSEKVLQQSENELGRLDEFVDRMQDKSQVLIVKTQLNPKLKKLQNSLNKAMVDDFNTPSAISSLFQLITQGNLLLDQGKMSKADVKEMLNFLKQTDMYFGFIFWGREKVRIPDEIKKLVELREQYRKEENWSKSDEVREQITERGWIAEDTSSGPKLKRIK